MISYVIVGSGYRAEYFARVAKSYPDLFSAVFLCRSHEKASVISKKTGIPATDSITECLSFLPDFIVVAVDRGHVAVVAEEWVNRGFPVLTETPVAATEEQLHQLERLSRHGARIICCEQYHRQPLLAAALADIANGTLGEPYSVYISAVHDYHAPSIIRKALLLQPDEPYKMHVMKQSNPVVETDSRMEAFFDGHTVSEERTVAMIQFACGKTSVYDFSPVQYRTYIRSRHITVRGTRGEWTDTMLNYLDERNVPRRKMLTPEIPERYRLLDTQALRDERRNWRFELAPNTVQDEYAIATFLLDMGEYVRGTGPAPYSFEEAAADARFWFELLKKSVPG